MKLKLENRTKVELRHSQFGRLEDTNQTYSIKKQEVSHLWQQMNILLQQYCSQCQYHYAKENNSTDIY